MVTVDWSEHKTKIVEIAVEEITIRGVNGYTTRTAQRLREQDDIIISPSAVGKGLTRAVPNWDEIREKAEKAWAKGNKGGPMRVEVEVKPEPLPGDHPQIVEFRTQLAAKKDHINALNRELKQARIKRSVSSELVALMEDEMVPFEYTPRKTEPEPVGQRVADMVLVLSDEHADHVISGDITDGLEHYDFNVFRARLQRLTDVVCDFATKYMQGYHVERLWIMSLGDKLQGSIHNFKLRNHFKNNVRATAACIDAEAHMIREFLDIFPSVHFVGVSGNHPRTTPKMENSDPHDNFDYLVGTGIAQRLMPYIKEKRLSVTLPRSWKAYVDVRGWRFALSHGDGVRGFAGFPWYGFDRQEGRVRALHNITSGGEDIDVFLYGHFHTSITRTGPASKSIHNGAFFMTDPYAYKQLAVGSNPEQRLLVMEDKKRYRGPIMDIPIYLRDPEREAALLRGEWEPMIGRRTVLDLVAGEWEPGAYPLIKG